MENPLITREQLKVEIDLVQEQHLETLYQLIKALQLPQDKQQTHLVSRLKAIQIHTPLDFAYPIDVDLTKEKPIENTKKYGTQLTEKNQYNLEALSGTWSEQQSQEFLADLSDLSLIDDELWR